MRSKSYLEILDSISHKYWITTQNIYLNILNEYDLMELGEVIEVSPLILKNIKLNYYKPSDLIIEKLIKFYEEDKRVKIQVPYNDNTSKVCEKLAERQKRKYHRYDKIKKKLAQKLNERMDKRFAKILALLD